ncbi:MAG: hypothetical protein WC023_01475 [Rhodocyclaceae bacterium]
MDQTLINWILACGGALLGAMLNAIWNSVKDLQKADTKLAERVGEIEVLVAGSYVKRDDMDKLAGAIFAKLDRIEAKLDGKADK